MTPETTSEIGFQIRGIRVASFTIHDEPDDPTLEVGFGLALQHYQVADGEDRTVEVNLSISVEEGQPPLVELKAACQYQLAGYQHWLSQLPENERQEGILPFGLAVTLNSISVSTTRGILFERLRGTNLQRHILPIIDPSAFQPLEE